MIDVYEINLLTETTMPPIIRCSQGDNGIRQVKFNLYNGSDVYTPQNLSAMVYGLRPDGASWGPEYCSISGSSVLFTLTEKMTMIGGRSTGELAFMDKNGNKISTTNFTLMVETMPLPGTYEESKCDFSGVVSQKLTEAMEKLEKEIAARKASDAELRQKLIDGGFYTDEDMTNKYNQGYNKGVSDADGRVNTSSASYSRGVSDADARTNTSSANYKAGYEAGKKANTDNGSFSAFGSATHRCPAGTYNWYMAYAGYDSDSGATGMSITGSVQGTLASRSYDGGMAWKVMGGSGGAWSGRVTLTSEQNVTFEGHPYNGQCLVSFIRVG